MDTNQSHVRCATTGTPGPGFFAFVFSNVGANLPLGLLYNVCDSVSPRRPAAPSTSSRESVWEPQTDSSGRRGETGPGGKANLGPSLSLWLRE